MLRIDGTPPTLVQCPPTETRPCPAVWRFPAALNLLHQLQQTLRERIRFGPIWKYLWPSGVGPRGEEPVLMSINPYPWAAPLEEVQLKPA